MCTVTFIPEGKQGFILTSNRDEKLTRPLSEPPRRYHLDSGIVVFPKDPQANGTWIAMGSRKISLCLLNGAFSNHVSRPPYRRSRGLVLLDFFDYTSATGFISTYDFEGIEPFTLLVLQTQEKLSLVEIRWDGTHIHLMPKDAAKPQIWSSATLYAPSVCVQRELWFTRFLAMQDQQAEADIMHFHRFAGIDDSHNALCMQRGNEIQTVSITSIRANDAGEQVMTYHDLVRETRQSYRIF
ncbi:NRDE family protein [Rhodocytophaga rosea]|uniref:NRDE family protein n=1 Tax=Rhodocytophaga rosea TaxID=2704465 RepID=A0A6C0GUV9_9BACT|nr:NRDE family protein [Rhodocytophaga rosea]QHT71786.1 NRDE family protein [Rhodocytophaga rosea]